MTPTKKRTCYETDMAFVRRFIEDARLGVRGTHAILNIYAVSGYGKSDFLTRIKEEYKRKLPTTLVRVNDFDKGEQKGGYRLDLMLRRMIAELQIGLPVWAKLDTDVTDISDLVYQLDKAICHAVDNDKIALILVDDYDRLPPGSKVLFDEAILTRLAKSPTQAVAVLTSQQELAFVDRLDLKARLETHPLSRCTEEDIKKANPQYAELAEEILKWTGGLSGLVEFLIQEMRRRSIDTLEDYRASEEEMLRGVYREHAKQVALGDMSQPARQAMPILSLLRRFDVSTLRRLLPQIDPDFGSYTTRQYLGLIDQIGSRAEWRDEFGYTIDDALRTVLSNYERVYDPEFYRKVHRVAERMYENLLKEQYHGHYIREMLYHKLARERLSPGLNFQDLVRLVSSELLAYISGERAPGPCDSGDIDELRNFRESLQQDETLNKFISPEVWSAIAEREKAIVVEET